MPVRRYVIGAVAGYGVVGDLYSPEDGDILISANVFSQEAVANYYDLLVISAKQPNLLVSVRWRYSVQIINADMSSIKVYDNQLGYVQYGRSKTSAFGYVSDNRFISFDKVISPIYSCVYRYTDGEELTDEPCSEPQDSSVAVDTLNGGWYAYTKEQPVDRQIPGSIQNYAGWIPGDETLVTMSNSVLLYRLGATYEYRIFEYDTDAWLDANDPPQIIF